MNLWTSHKEQLYFGSKTSLCKMLFHSSNSTSKNPSTNSTSKGIFYFLYFHSLYRGSELEEASSHRKYTLGSYKQRGVSREQGGGGTGSLLGLKPKATETAPPHPQQDFGSRLATEFEEWVNRMSLVMSWIKVDKEKVFRPKPKA